MTARWWCGLLIILKWYDTIAKWIYRKKASLVKWFATAQTSFRDSLFEIDDIMPANTINHLVLSRLFGQNYPWKIHEGQKRLTLVSVWASMSSASYWYNDELHFFDYLWWWFLRHLAAGRFVAFVSSWNKVAVCAHCQNAFLLIYRHVVNILIDAI